VQPFGQPGDPPLRWSHRWADQRELHADRSVAGDRLAGPDVVAETDEAAVQAVHPVLMGSVYLTGRRRLVQVKVPLAIRLPYRPMVSPK